MTLEERVRILEEQVRGLIKSRALDKMYTEADINGTRQSVANITPIVMTQKGYIQAKAVRFENVPDGQITVSCIVPYSIYKPNYCDWLEVRFDDPLTEVIDVTISIL